MLWKSGQDTVQFIHWIDDKIRIEFTTVVREPVAIPGRTDRSSGSYSAIHSDGTTPPAVPRDFFPASSQEQKETGPGQVFFYRYHIIVYHPAEKREKADFFLMDGGILGMCIGHNFHQVLAFTENFRRIFYHRIRNDGTMFFYLVQQVGLPV